jgi:hypothetical protein
MCDNHTSYFNTKQNMQQHMNFLFPHTISIGLRHQSEQYASGANVAENKLMLSVCNCLKCVPPLLLHSPGSDEGECLLCSSVQLTWNSLKTVGNVWTSCLMTSSAMDQSWCATKENISDMMMEWKLRWAWVQTLLHKNQAWGCITGITVLIGLAF